MTEKEDSKKRNTSKRKEKQDLPGTTGQSDVQIENSLNKARLNKVQYQDENKIFELNFVPDVESVSGSLNSRSSNENNPEQDVFSGLMNPKIEEDGFKERLEWIMKWAMERKESGHAWEEIDKELRGRIAAGSYNEFIPTAHSSGEVIDVFSSALYQALREALAQNLFTRSGDPEKNPWPTAILRRGRASGRAQLIPPMETEPWLMPPEKAAALNQVMWEQQKQLGDLDADVLDMLSQIWLKQAAGPTDFAVATVDQFLALRGIKPRLGRKSSYQTNDRRDMMEALSHIQNIWLDLGEVEIYEESQTGETQREKVFEADFNTVNNEDPGKVRIKDKEPVSSMVNQNNENNSANEGEAQTKSGRPKGVKKQIQSRAFLITDRMGQLNIDGHLEVDRFAFIPGRLFAQFLYGPGRQTALLATQALKYDPYRQTWEKRLARYLSWRWRISAKDSDYNRPYRVGTLLEAVGKTGLRETEKPSRVKDRLENALDQLHKDGIIASWEYESRVDGRGWNEEMAGKAGWYKTWQQAMIMLAPPDIIIETYQTIERNRELALRKGRSKNRSTYSSEQKIEAESSFINPSSSGPRFNPDWDTSSTNDANIEILIAGIQERRDRLSLSQSEAAAQIGITQSGLSRIEKGQRRPSKEIYRLLTSWLNSPSSS